MNVSWLEQTEADVPAENDWLHAREAIGLNGLRFAKRRADWRLGRWTAKRALALCLNLPLDHRTLAGIEIRPAPDGVPEVFLANAPAAITISISHRDGRAICAVALSGVALGCDLEIIEPHSAAFVADYFTTEEQRLVARAPAPDRLRLLALLWSAKESTLKALRAGLRLDTRSVIVSPVDEGADSNTWHPLRVTNTSGQIFHGWWRYTGNLLQTVVADPPPTPPILLKIPAYENMERETGIEPATNSLEGCDSTIELLPLWREDRAVSS
jgi:4'-phosphopantetheinyl transferase